ncbi:alpha/beta fold hydrolase [Cognatishimia sp. F0-27]|uniref:alpha/beta fold hydrolase n=1 Tax=Cognatishimia sp. F0-27 TaxID=2816855 RepID=UPI001D0CA7E9|nr:alpha/beta hydrolase [Cognatishimia sp. F0-27]MCC1494086.1 alpha/beta hydrolase [Cognatishimia sp. F0-27]
MTLASAPFFADLAEGPAEARGWWVQADDGLRLRVAHYPSDEARGTIFLFPGRTEYVEKYGRTADDFAARGYHTLTIDWRGQGMADRMLDDRLAGHVAVFEDYQRDVAAMMRAAEQLDLPRPYHLIGHSMGGAIGLRAVINGLPVASCAFTGPMWGIKMRQAIRPAAWALSWSSKQVGLSHLFAPGTGIESYTATGAFEDNTLTTDPDMWDYMRRQVLAQPELQLGGPSMHWLHEALAECWALSRLPSPRVPCLTYCGTNERIVDVPRIADRMARWPNGRLEMLDGAEHEILMERPEIREVVIAGLTAHFDRAGEAPALSA